VGIDGAYLYDFGVLSKWIEKTGLKNLSWGQAHTHTHTDTYTCTDTHTHNYRGTKTKFA